jgi:hypothetical protein
MPPCLRSPDRDRVQQPRRSNSPPRHQGRRPRSASLPVTTLPLRGCCKACIPAVDAYLASPSRPEHMTTGAKRLLRSASQQDYRTPSESKVMVDEVDMIRKDIHKVTISDESSTVQDNVSSPEGQKIRPKLSLGVCFYDEAEEFELFPLPSPSPRSSPRQSPFPSPSASQTNLAASGSKTTPSPIVRGNSPLSVCCSGQTDKLNPSTEEYLREEASRIYQRDLPSPVKAESHPTLNPKPRRPSLSGLGSSFSRGGLAIVKGFSGLGGPPIQ